MNALLIFLFVFLLQMPPSMVFGGHEILPQYSFNKGPGYIHASGSWVGDSPASGAPYFREFAVQTSEIACYEALGTCFEARAVSKGPVMYSNLMEYKIIEWNPARLLAVLEGAAATIELR